MLIEKVCEETVPVPIKNTVGRATIPRTEVAALLLKLLKKKKCDVEHGYYLAVTEVIGIGKPEQFLSFFLFPVRFRCRTFAPQTGDVMIGTVGLILSSGAWLKCGPVRIISLPGQLMSDYSYVGGEKPYFISNDQSRVDYDIPVRFKVLAARWVPVKGKPVVTILATINESSLGPIQSAGCDAEEFVCLSDD